MHLLRRHDLDHHDLVFHLVHDLVLLQPMVHLDDNFQQQMVRPNLYAVDIAKEHLMHLQGAVMMDVPQNLDALNLDEVQTFQDAVRHYLVIPVMIADAQVDAEQRLLLKMDCFQDEVDEEPRSLLNQM
jgi:hypothetical protein